MRKYETVGNLNAASEPRPSHSGGSRKRTTELVDVVRESIQQSPKRSARKRSHFLGISRETCRRALESDIKAYPYRIQKRQNLTVLDKQRTLKMVVKLLEKIEMTPGFLNPL